MKVLLLVQDEQRVNLDPLYEGIAAHCRCDVRRLSDDDQRNLRRYFQQHVDVEQYQRIVLFLRFKKELRQVGFLRSLPNLVFLEHDAYLNYLGCKYRGRFSAHYRRLPWARIIVSGCSLARRLREEGFDAVFVPKGYDSGLLRDLGCPRDIELAFVGSTRNAAYIERKALLDELSRLENLAW